jgi:TRAP-type mannitol/chloroaromatic compound transport system permease large subunit
MAAYYLKGISPPHILITQIFWGCMPFQIIVVLSMAIMYLWPQLVLWLPRAIYGN